MRTLRTSFLKAYRSGPARRFALLAWSRVAASLLQAVLFALVARAMGLNDFGSFTIGLSIALLTMSVFELGLGNRSLRVLGDDEPGRTVLTVILIRGATNAIAIVLIFGIAALLLGISPWAAAALALYVTGDLFGNLTQSLLIGLLRERTATILLLIRRLLPVALAGVFFLLAAESTESAYIALALSGLLGYVTGTAALLRESNRPHNLIMFIKNNLSFAATSFGSNLQQADALVVGAVGGSALAGLYGAAARLASPLNLLTGSVMQAIVPTLATRDHGERAVMMRTVLRVMTLAAGFLALAAACSPLIMLVLYGDEFVEGWPIASAVILMAALNALNQPILGWFYAGHITRSIPILVTLNSITLVAAVGIGALISQPIAIAAGMILSALLFHTALRIHYNSARRQIPEAPKE